MPARFLALLMLASTTCAFAEGKLGLSPTKPAGGPAVETYQGYMVPYDQPIPGTDVTFKMTPVPGGVVELGLRSPAGDEEALDFSPAIQVRVPPRWVGVREVSWAEYWVFMDLTHTFTKIAYLRGQLFEGNAKIEAELKNLTELKLALSAQGTHVDGVTAPTPLYDPETTYTSGQEPDLPAVSMTLYAAKQYTKWLTAVTGQPYRLPSEAEWEHAARAGVEGDQIADRDLGDFAWYTRNSNYDSHKTGAKQPNAWGLHDVIGNAAEWVLDAPSNQPPVGAQPLSWREAISLPTQLFPRIVKGGYFDSEADGCRFAARMLSNDEDWKASDPNIPLSPWWFTDAPGAGVGMRVVRPLAPMDEPTKQLAWEIDSDELQTEVEMRLREGRGKLQSIDEDLPKVIEQLESDRMRKLME